ncbi:MAG: hypothetical protein LBG58_06790 [Planctomycetaceae bacterium]|nr:hypothetical protein [Planctomycetaceae bacterium]
MKLDCQRLVFSQPSGCGSADSFEGCSEECRYGTHDTPNRPPKTTNIIPLTIFRRINILQRYFGLLP